MKKIKILFLLFLLLGVSVTRPVLAKDFTPAEVAVYQDKHINDLKWNNEYSRIRIVNSGLGLQYSLMLFGNYFRDGWKIKYNGKLIDCNDRGGFRLEIPISKDDKVFEFEAVGPKGEVEKEQIAIHSAIKEIDKADRNLRTGHGSSGEGWTENAPVKKFFLIPGVGVSSITYKQSKIADYTTLAVTPKIALNINIVPQKWDLGLSTFFTAVQLSKSSATAVKFLGINLRFGYLVPNISTDWFLSIYGGWYYTTTFVTNEKFGYYNLSGPQLYPSVRRVMANGDIIGVYFKYSPIASSLSLLTLSSREIGTGLSYVKMLANEHSIGATFDISNINLTFEGIDTKTNSLTLGIQYGL